MGAEGGGEGLGVRGWGWGVGFGVGLGVGLGVGVGVGGLGGLEGAKGTPCFRTSDVIERGAERNRIL